MVIRDRITTIEVALILSLMLAGGKGTTFLARDTIFATEMIIMTITVMQAGEIMPLM